MSKSNLPGVDEKSYSTYPWDKKGKQAKDHFERKEFKGFYVSRSGLIFDKRGKYRPPNFRYNLDGEIHKRRLRITEDGKRKEYGYDRFVYAAWNQDTFDIEDKDLIIYRGTYTNSGHVDDLRMCTRGELLSKIHDKRRYIPKKEHPKVYETWCMVKDVMTLDQFRNHLGLPKGVLERIIELEENNG